MKHFLEGVMGENLWVFLKKHLLSTACGQQTSQGDKQSFSYRITLNP